jgi:hypothetical protein
MILYQQWPSISRRAANKVCALRAVHLTLDLGRDLIVKKYGEEWANIAESVGNIVYDIFKNKPSRSRKRKGK